MKPHILREAYYTQQQLLVKPIVDFNLWNKHRFAYYQYTITSVEANQFRFLVKVILLLWNRKISGFK